MAISFRTQSFQDALSKLREEQAAGNLQTREDAVRILADRGIDIDDYNKAKAKYNEAIAAGEDIRGFERSEGLASYVPSVATSPLRAVARTLSEIGTGAESLASLVTGGASDDVIKAVSEALPESLQETFDELSDPYHGETAVGAVEDIGGTLASYVVGGGLLLKGASKAAKGIRGVNGAVKPAGSRSMISKQFKNLNRQQRKARIKKIQRNEKLAQVGKQELGFAGAAALIDDPQEGLVNFLIEAYPEAEQYLSALAINPDDSELEGRFKNFLTGLGLAVPFSVPALVKAFKSPVAKAATTSAQPAKSALSKVPYLRKLPKVMANFSSRLGTDDTMLSLIQKASTATEGAMVRAEGLAAELSEAVEKAYGKNVSDDIIKKLNDALEGNSTALASLDSSVRPLISEMRNNIDTLSKETMGGLKQGKLQTKIGKNLGTYVTRSYKFYDDPGFKKDVQKRWVKFRNGDLDADKGGVFSDALASIEKGAGVDSKEALNILEEILSTKDALDFNRNLDGINTFGNIINTKSSISRKQVPDTVRALLGEVKDPYRNYVKTMGNLTKITSEQKFLSDVARHLGDTFSPEMGAGITSLKDVGEGRLAKVLGGKGVASANNPLENIYADEIYKKAIKEGLDVIYNTDVDTMMGKLMNGFTTLKGLSQASKTAFSVPTHGRNILGNGFLMVANGYVPLGGKGMKEAMSSTMNKFRNITNRELADQWAEYIELGIANSSVNANVIKNNLRKFAQDPDSALLSSINSETGFVKGLGKKVMQAYQLEDDFFKVMHYEKTLDTLRKSAKYANEPESVIKEAAAARTRDLMPNYNLVPKFFKDLRQMPVGDFMAFPAEMARVTKNLVKYSIDDVTSGDATLQAAGLKRLAGITAAGMIPTALAEKSRLMNGITEDQHEALENVGKDFEWGQDKIYLSPIQEDKNGHFGVEYFNFGPIDPFSYLKTGASAAHGLILSGISDDERVNLQTDKMALKLLDTVAGPYLSPSMITEGFFNTANRIREGGGFNKNTLEYALEPLYKTFVPGTVDFIINNYNYNQSLAKQEPYGQEAIKKFGTTFKESEVDIPAFLGLKRSYLDISNGINFNVSPIIRDIDNVTKPLKSRLKTDPLFTGREAEEMYFDSQKTKHRKMQELNAVLDDYRTIFGDDSFNYYFEDGLTAGQRFARPESYFETLNEAMNNSFLPDEIYYEDYMDINKPDMNWDNIRKIRDAWSNVYLFPEDEEEY